MKQHAARSQHGFSIVELMVALLLGSMITVAAVSLFSTNQRTFLLQQGITGVQEQGRFALDYMSLDIRKLGYMEQADEATVNAAMGTSRPGVVLNDLTRDGILYPRSTEGGNNATDNDRLTFAYMGTVDCEGDQSAVRTFIVVTYWVDGAGSLFCQGSVDPATGGVALVRGVRSFQVLFGRDTTLDEQPEVTQYVQASTLGAGDPVLGVRIGIVIGDRVEGVPDIPDGRNFAVLDKQLVSGQAPLDQRELLRVFTTTVKVRNYDWSGV